MNNRIKVFGVLAFIIVSFGCTSQNNSNFDINKFVKEKYPNCSEPKFCNNLVEVDCNSAADGPLYYLNRTNGNQISSCGGSCMLADDNQSEICKNLCPPKEWTCD